MEVYVNYPKDENSINKLSENVAEFHATLLLDNIEKLFLDRKSETIIIKKLFLVLKENDNIKKC